MNGQTAEASLPSVGSRLDPSYLESMFQGAGLGIVACNSDGQIATWNAAAGRLFRGAPACREGGAVVELLPEQDRRRGQEALAKCLTLLEAVEFRSRLGGTDDDPLEYAVYITPVLDADGTLRGVAVWFRDITQRIRLQRALKKHDRLSVLGALSKAIAHHYNNLLGCIATNIDYASKTNMMSAVRRALGRAAEAATRATQITQQLLAFAQADHRDTDLADVAEMVLLYFDNNEARLNQHNVRLQFDWQVIPILPVRRQQLQLVLNNLVENALEAMKEGGTLTVRLHRRDEDSVVLSISDTGGGINAEDMEHIFEPFHSSKARLGCGEHGKAGLGLAVVHGLVHEMRGEITAANIPGAGARFDIILPISGTEHPVT